MNVSRLKSDNGMKSPRNMKSPRRGGFNFDDFMSSRGGMSDYDMTSMRSFRSDDNY